VLATKGSDLFSAKTDPTPFLQPTLADFGIHLDRPEQGYWRVTTDRLIFEPGVERAIEQALCDALGTRDEAGASGPKMAHADSPQTPAPPRPVQPALTYLANAIACRNREIPYSLVAALDFADKPPLGPMLSAEGKPLAPLADGQIALNTWAAEELGAKVGDTIRVSFFEPESTHGQVRQKTEELMLAAIVQLSGAAADPALTPDVPGVTDRLTLADWNPPFPFDARKVRKKDEDYWHARRGTPKAFVSLATGRRLWASRFGQTTCLRIAPAQGQSIEQLRDRLRPDPAALGFVVQPVRRQGLAASQGTTPFEVLFLFFSMFLIASAVMLVAILFRLGVDRRANEIGILLAAGFRRRHVVLLLAGEGLVVTAAGSLLGLGAGVGYAALMLAGLESWWLAAVSTPFLSLHFTRQSLLIGYFSGVIVALGAIVASARRAARAPPRQLLAGRTTGTVPIFASTKMGLSPLRGLAGRSPLAAIVAWATLAGAIALGLAAGALGQEARAGAFFGAGALVLAAALAWVWTRLAAGATGPAVAPGGGNLLRLAVRSAARNPGRSTLTIGLVAAASFLIAAVSAFRVDPRGGLLGPESGNGGFALVAQSDQPIYHDLNTPEGRRELAFSEEDSRRLTDSHVFSLRVRPGDDASCLNLYQPQQPRILGVPKALRDRGGFAWASFLRVTEADPRLPPDARDAASNPWRLLELRLGTDEDGVPRVPVILEKNTANYSLHLWKGVGQTYDVADGRGGTVRLQIVGLLSGSIFQGDLLVSESALLECFPREGGYREFLVETPPDQAADVQRALERALSDFGLAVETTAERLAAFQAVQNTYLSTFQSLGGLGLLLGTFGLAAVQLRSVLERRSELALLRAVGFRRRMLAGLVLLENALVLMAGLACGVLAALVAIVPHLVTGGATIPWGWLGAMLAMVLAAGLLAGLGAVRAALATPLMAALRGE
jgi:ABC-type lipoprotein release transport system permease subunit